MGKEEERKAWLKRKKARDALLPPKEEDITDLIPKLTRREQRQLETMPPEQRRVVEDAIKSSPYNNTKAILDNVINKPLQDIPPFPRHPVELAVIGRLEDDIRDMTNGKHTKVMRALPNEELQDFLNVENVSFTVEKCRDMIGDLKKVVAHYRAAQEAWKKHRGPSETYKAEFEAARTLLKPLAELWQNINAPFVRESAIDPHFPPVLKDGINAIYDIAADMTLLAGRMEEKDREKSPIAK